MLSDIDDDDKCNDDAATVAFDAANGVDNSADGNENNAILSSSDLATANPYPNGEDLNQSLNETKPLFQRIITRLAAKVQTKKGKGKGKIQKMKRKQTPKKRAKMIKCSKCDYTSPRQYRINEHSAVHSTERPFKCDNCDTCFKYRDNLKRHMGKQHNVVLL